MKTKIARFLLKRSGWIEDYYYVIKVMYSCMNTPDIGKANNQLTKTFYWGMNQLTNRWLVLAGRYPSFKTDLLVECHKYTDDLFDIKWKIQDKINYETV